VRNICYCYQHNHHRRRGSKGQSSCRSTKKELGLNMDLSPIQPHTDLQYIPQYAIYTAVYSTHYSIHYRVCTRVYSTHYSIHTLLSMFTWCTFHHAVLWCSKPVFITSTARVHKLLTSSALSTVGPPGKGTPTHPCRLPFTAYVYNVTSEYYSILT